MCLHLLVETFHNGRNFDRKRCLMDSNAFILAGQVALMTGASSGLGRATALALAQAGADLVQLATSDWDYVLDVNLRAPFLLAKAIFPYMSQERRGTIITISSVAGKRGWANASAYCASKFGLTGFTQALAAEGKAYGIRACVIYPGAMATHWGAWSSTQRVASGPEPPPVTKALPPAEVASLIVWIATAPPELVLNEAIISPLEAEGWP